MMNVLNDCVLKTNLKVDLKYEFLIGHGTCELQEEICRNVIRVQKMNNKLINLILFWRLDFFK